jgi:hypothetical protein
MMPELLRSLDSQDLEAQGVTLSRPSLDDVFLKYTGRSLREDERKMLSRYFLQFLDDSILRLLPIFGLRYNWLK